MTRVLLALAILSLMAVETYAQFTAPPRQQQCTTTCNDYGGRRVCNTYCY